MPRLSFDIVVMALAALKIRTSVKPGRGQFKCNKRSFFFSSNLLPQSLALTFFQHYGDFIIVYEISNTRFIRLFTTEPSIENRL